jgi:hypothetical protein
MKRKRLGKEKQEELKKKVWIQRQKANLSLPSTL